MNIAKRPRLLELSDSEDDAPLASFANDRSLPRKQQNSGDTQTIIQLLMEIRAEQDRHATILDKQALLQERQSNEIQQISSQLLAQKDESNNLKQELQNMSATISNMYGLFRGRIEKRSRLDGSNVPEQSVGNEPQPANKTTSGMTKPVADMTDGFVSIPIRHEEIRPGVVYEPVRIPADDYASLLNRSATASTFVRGIMPYFFEKDVLRSSNYDGTTVLRKDQEPLKKDKLDRRLVMSLLDQAELEFPGHIFDRKSFTKIRALINDKCRHS